MGQAFCASAGSASDGCEADRNRTELFEAPLGDAGCTSSGSLSKDVQDNHSSNRLCIVALKTGEREANNGAGVEKLHAATEGQHKIRERGRTDFTPPFLLKGLARCFQQRVPAIGARLVHSIPAQCAIATLRCSHLARLELGSCELFRDHFCDDLHQ